jgi:hypothetical protein
MPRGGYIEPARHNVAVPVENLIGEENNCLAVAFTGLNTERILTSSTCAGIGRYAMREAWPTSMSGGCGDSRLVRIRRSPIRWRPRTFILA